MPQPDNPFARADAWVFDLDNTLYPPSARLFDQINERMTGFIMRELGLARAEADRLRARYWRQHGITLRGLIDDHRIDAAGFLAEVHAIDLTALRPDPELAAAITALPGRKIVHTNGARVHAEAVLHARGLTAVFERVYTIEDKDYVPKPQPAAYAVVAAAAGIRPERAVMVEDDPVNLAVPKAMGMATVWLAHDDRRPAPAHVDRRIERLEDFLADPC